VSGLAVVAELEETAVSRLREGLLSASGVMDGLSQEEQLKVAAGVYDAKYPRLRETYVSALVDEMARVILANELAFQQCTDVHWPRPEESWHLAEESDTIN
jgi:hypothetical protein